MNEVNERVHSNGRALGSSVPAAPPDAELEASFDSPASTVDQTPGGATHSPAGPRAKQPGRSRVVIGIRDLAFHQEVLDWLGRDFRVEVVGAAAEPERLLQQLARETPDVALLCPMMARHFAHPSTRSQRPRTLLVAQEMTVPVLREAIDLGVQGVFAWPEERDDLSAEITRAGVARSFPPAARGLVVAVLGARGGAGATFLATHLAAVFAGQGVRCVLVDLEGNLGDLTVALGVRSEDRIRTIADLLPVMDELSSDHLLDALHHHPMGFAALLAPPPEPAPLHIPSGLYTAGIALLAVEFEVVILHLPRSEADVVRRAVALSDEVLLVVTLDLLSLYGARRTISSLRDQGSASTRVVLNRLARADVTPSDVERTLGSRPWGTIRFDSAVKRVQDRGELLPTRSRRAGKDVRRLCELLRQDWATAHQQEGA
jgi:pilus assembly protein CpaE